MTNSEHLQLRTGFENTQALPNQKVRKKVDQAAIKLADGRAQRSGEYIVVVVLVLKTMIQMSRTLILEFLRVSVE